MNMEVITLRKITKIGTSLGIILPKYVIHGLELERGDQLVFRVLDGGVITMRKITSAELKYLRGDVII